MVFFFSHTRRFFPGLLFLASIALLLFAAFSPGGDNSVNVPEGSTSSSGQFQLELEASHEYGADFILEPDQLYHQAGDAVLVRGTLMPGYSFNSWSDGQDTWVIEPEHLVAHWPFNEGAGNQVKDTTDHQHHGEVFGAGWMSEGAFGGALEFDGENDRVVIPHSEDFNVSGALTLSTWIKPEGPLTGHGGEITEVGEYVVHTFAETGEDLFMPPDGVEEVEVLVVGGGGGGGKASNGHNSAGGGGGGGVILRAAGEEAGRYSVSGPVDVVVGDGGASSGTDRGSPGDSGEDSSFGDLIAIGGGGGGSTDSGHAPSGGSGGGGGGNSNVTGGDGLQPDSDSGGYGNRGGDQAGASNSSRGGGGGGAMEEGETMGGSGDGRGAHGGAGLLSDFSGDEVMYGSGGGGGRRGRGHPGGLGGGIGPESGASDGGAPHASDAPPNQGGGGGGGGTRSRGQGGDGGSGCCNGLPGHGGCHKMPSVGPVIPVGRCQEAFHGGVHTRIRMN